MSWPTSGMVAPAFSHSTLRSSSGAGGSGSSSFRTQAGVPWARRRLSHGRWLGVGCFSGCWAAGGPEGVRARAEGEGRTGCSQMSGRDRGSGKGGREAPPRAGPGAGVACRGHREVPACSAPLVWPFPTPAHYLPSQTPMGPWDAPIAGWSLPGPAWVGAGRPRGGERMGRGGAGAAFPGLPAPHPAGPAALHLAFRAGRLLVPLCVLQLAVQVLEHVLVPLPRVHDLLRGQRRSALSVEGLPCQAPPC